MAERSRLLVWQDPVSIAAAAREMTGLEYLSAFTTGELPPPPIAVAMRMQPVELGQGRAVFEGAPDELHYNAIGTVHGGYAATLLDSALGCAVHSTLGIGEAYTTLTLEIKMVRAITADMSRVRATAGVQYRGRRHATATADVVDPSGDKLLAHGSSTCMIFPVD